jgi:hypothetical protein
MAIHRMKISRPYRHKLELQLIVIKGLVWKLNERNLFYMSISEIGRR